jgi:CBS domain-containing protein
MEKFPFYRILEFVYDVEPFSRLSRQQLSRLVREMEIGYYPRGELIIKQGEELASHVHIIYTGSVRVTIIDDSANEILIDIRGEKEIFGAMSLVLAKYTQLNVIANEDLLTFMLPADKFLEIVNEFPFFKDYFKSSLARNFCKALQQSSESGFIGATSLRELNDQIFLLSKKVSDLMTKDILTCSKNISIRDAAKLMTEWSVGSVVVKEKNGKALGILTDVDLRKRVVSAGYSLDAPVSEVMSSPLHKVRPDYFSYDALLDMSRFGVNHLLVMDNDTIVGILSEHDFQIELGSSPVGLIRDIEKSQSLDEVISMNRKIDSVLELLLRQGGSVKKMVNMISELNDRITKKILKLNELNMEKEGLVRPMARYTWMCLGSEGRREQTLRTDQDNAIIFISVSESDESMEEKARAWFLDFSERVVQSLVRYGFPRCPGGIMASNPKWCQNQNNWEKTFMGWIDDPNPLSLRMSSIFFDFRAIYAEDKFLEELHEKLLTRISSSQFFLRFMAKNSLYNVPPLGFFKNLVLLKSGEHKDKLNLKIRGILPVVESVRVLSLDLGIKDTNTWERLSQIHERGLLTNEFYSDLWEAYSFLQHLRITCHLRDREKGIEADNFLNPANLNTLQRNMLKDSFAIIRRLQEMLEFRYQTQFLMGI